MPIQNYFPTKISRDIDIHYPDPIKVTIDVTQVNTIVPGVAKWLMIWTDGPYNNNTFPKHRTDVASWLTIDFFQCQHFWFLTAKMFFMAPIFGSIGQLGMGTLFQNTYMLIASCENNQGSPD